MTQLHKRFTDDQIKVLLNGYCQGLLARAEIQEMLGIGKTRFCAGVRRPPGAMAAIAGGIPICVSPHLIVYFY
jgi:hypothetical protein